MYFLISENVIFDMQNMELIVKRRLIRHSILFSYQSNEKNLKICDINTTSSSFCSVINKLFD